ncbi:MAG: ABC transporter ATP-binding protein [Thermodesulfobacteriota bacterium]
MIHITGLSKYYQDVCAVNNIDLTIKQGEIVGLLGPNAAGKTTTLRILTGYLRPSCGNVHVKNFNLTKDILKIKRLMGYLPETPPLYKNLLVYDYMRYLGQVREMDKEFTVSRIEEVIKQCGLTSVMHKNIGELSKGYQQRLGIAHALLHDPEILILDEPTTGLDPNQIQEIRNLIREIGQQKTVILSTHILSEAEATCDRMVIIHQGNIVADGTSQELKQSSNFSPTIHLTLKNADQNEVTSILSRISGVQEIVSNKPDTSDNLEFKIRCQANQDLRERIYATIKNTNWTLLQFYLQTQTLENIFKELTQES